MKKIFIATISLCFWWTTHAQSVTATVDRTKILIGEKIQLQLKAFIPQNQPLQWFTIDSIPHFEIMQKMKLDTQMYQDNFILTQTLVLTSWDSGRWNIPPLRLGSQTTGAITIFVGHTPFDVSQPYNDIHDIIEVKTSRPSNWYWYFLGAILLITLIMLLFPGTKKEKEPQSELDPGAYQKAVKRLRQLNDSNLQATDVKAYYTELIDIFRWYVQARKGIVSFHRTTNDLAVQLQQLSLSKDDYTQLVQVLRMGDLVKYARYQPHRQENEESFEKIKRSIELIEDAV